MLLAIASSSGRLDLCLGDNGRLHGQWSGGADAARSDPADILARALTESGLARADITAIAVDTGPGRLSATRCGVSFANGLGFALQVPVYPVGAFDVMADLVRRKQIDAAVLCVARAGGGHFHFGLYDRGEKPRFFFCAPEKAAAFITSDTHKEQEWVIVGRGREAVPPALPRLRITDGGIEGANAAAIIALDPPGKYPAPLVGVAAIPLTEWNTQPGATA